MSNKITVYRVENEEGFGPYLIDYAWCKRLHRHPRNPGPRHDRPIHLALTSQLSTNDDRDIYSVLTNYVFGFIDMDQLNAWFDHEELLKLKELGYRISVYKLEESAIVKGNKQILMNKKVWRELFEQQAKESLTYGDMECITISFTLDELTGAA